MLSVLIPVYNWDVTVLVQGLARQCEDSGVPFEIRCYEDGSDPGWRQCNEVLTGMEGVVYRVFTANQGRSRIRNLLAADAQFPYLLFLDADSGLPHDQFIANYTRFLREEDVLYGGRIYPPMRPANVDQLLHWHYGRRREAAPAIRRRLFPYDRFMTNNFLIPKGIFDQMGFDERLIQYGHEDTIFGLELRERGIPIVHLDNPVIHLGLESASIFLDKNRQAVENLYFLCRYYPDLTTPLLRAVKKLEAWHLDRLAFMVLRWLLPLLRSNLLSRHPLLPVLDLYKLYFLLFYDQRGNVDAASREDP